MIVKVTDHRTGKSRAVRHGERLKGISDRRDLRFSFSFFISKVFKKDTTSVFHKDINVYTPATQKNKSSKMFIPNYLHFF